MLHDGDGDSGGYGGGDTSLINGIVLSSILVFR